MMFARRRGTATIGPIKEADQVVLAQKQLNVYISNDLGPFPSTCRLRPWPASPSRSRSCSPRPTLRPGATDGFVGGPVALRRVPQCLINPNECCLQRLALLLVHCLHIVARPDAAPASGRDGVPEIAVKRDILQQIFGHAPSLH